MIKVTYVTCGELQNPVKLHPNFSKKGVNKDLNTDQYTHKQWVDPSKVMWIPPFTFLFGLEGHDESLICYREDRRIWKSSSMLISGFEFYICTELHKSYKNITLHHVLYPDIHYPVVT